MSVENRVNPTATALRMGTAGRNEEYLWNHDSVATENVN
jgi:hypothetical protein